MNEGKKVLLSNEAKHNVYMFSQLESLSIDPCCVGFCLSYAYAICIRGDEKLSK